MKILIVGTGYVGLVTGTCFAEMGHTVTCLDIDPQKIDLLKKGKSPIYEPGLEEMMQRNSKAKRLFFTTSYKEGLKNTSLIFLAVPTPSKEDGSCNTDYIEAATQSIGALLEQEVVLVNKSTAPIGTAYLIQKTLQKALNKRRKNIDFEVVSNPEFLKEGSALQDCMKPDRIVIGVETEKAKKVMQELYAPFTFNHDRILFMRILSAEMTKYAANAMLATRISFMNEMAEICSLTGADIHEVRKGIGSDSRIGYSFLYAGVGYGGSCFPKDIRALRALAQKKGYTPKLLDAVETVNETQKEKLSKEILKYFASRGGIEGKVIAVWGVAFKPDTDDIREAPALTFIQDLQKRGAILRIYDPVALSNAKKALSDHTHLHWCKSEIEATEKADAIALLTEWKQFRLVNFSPIQKKMHGKAIFDGRNQYKPQEMKEKGFDYIGIGTSS